MKAAINVIAVNFDYFLLTFLRMTALVVSSPVFGRKNIPNGVKIGFCVVLTYAVFVAFPQTAAIKYSTMLGFVGLCVKEILFGLVLGYVTTLFFSIVQTAGYVVDLHMGFGMVNVLDTHTGGTVPITGNFMEIILLLSFFGVNGHHQLIYILNSTLLKMPVGNITLNAKIGWAALEVFVLSFVMAVNVSIPMIASGLLGELILGFIVRAVPQMNIFVVGIPLKILLGFIMLLIIMPLYVSFTGSIFSNMFRAIDGMLTGLAGAP